MILYYRRDDDFGVTLVAKQFTLPGITLPDAYINVEDKHEHTP